MLDHLPRFIADHVAILDIDNFRCAGHAGPQRIDLCV